MSRNFLYQLRFILGLFIFLIPIQSYSKNILLVLADDFGVDAAPIYSRDDLYVHADEESLYSSISTPTIDSLAMEGILFRNAYTNPMCSPTRASILTGKYPFQTGLGWPAQAQLNTNETIIPEILPQSYRSAAIGKWHLTSPTRGRSADKDHAITSGFEYFAGSLAGMVTDYNNWTKIVSSINSGTQTQNAFTTYATTDTANEAINKIAEFGDEPWFIWLAFNAPHSPYHVPDSSLTTNDITNNSTNVSKYSAMIEAMDTELGRVIQSIPEEILANTTIIFIGDNGTPSNVTRSPFLSNHAKGTQYDGGINIPFIVKSPQLISTADEGKESLAYVSTIDIFSTIAEIVNVSIGNLPSVSILPYLAKPELSTQSIRPYVFTEHFEPNGFGPYENHERAVSYDNWKLIWRNNVVEEFFNLLSDPYETTNLLIQESLNEEQTLIYNQLVCVLDNIEVGDASDCISSDHFIPLATNKNLFILLFLLLAIVINQHYHYKKQ